jgi:urease gamma subunit
MYKEIVSQDFRMLDEDTADIDAVRQQMQAMQRLIIKMRMRSKAGRRWQTEMLEGIDHLLHDTSTDWLIENGRYLVAVREPF